MPQRRFPPPWIVEEHAESFVDRDATGQALGYFYFHGEKSGGRPSGTKRLSKDEARQMAVTFAKLPEFLKWPQ
jgi:hypothetical protein